MNDETDDHDHADEDILTYNVSDEALEAAAGTDGRAFSIYSAIAADWRICC